MGFGTKTILGLVFTSNNEFILQFDNVWEVKEVQRSAWCRSTAHPSPPGAVVTLSTESCSTEARGTK